MGGTIKPIRRRVGTSERQPVGGTNQAKVDSWLERYKREEGNGDKDRRKKWRASISLKDIHSGFASLTYLRQPYIVEGTKRIVQWLDQSSSGLHEEGPRSDPDCPEIEPRIIGRSIRPCG